MKGFDRERDAWMREEEGEQADGASASERDKNVPEIQPRIKIPYAYYATLMTSERIKMIWGCPSLALTESHALVEKPMLGRQDGQFWKGVENMSGISGSNIQTHRVCLTMGHQPLFEHTWALAF